MQKFFCLLLLLSQLVGSVLHDLLQVRGVLLHDRYHVVKDIGLPGQDTQGNTEIRYWGR